MQFLVFIIYLNKNIIIMLFFIAIMTRRQMLVTLIKGSRGDRGKLEQKVCFSQFRHYFFLKINDLHVYYLFNIRTRIIILIFNIRTFT